MTKRENEILEQLLRRHDRDQERAENAAALKVFGFTLFLIVALQFLAAWAVP